MGTLRIVGRDGSTYDVVLRRADLDLVAQVAHLFESAGNLRSQELFEWAYLGYDDGAFMALAYPSGSDHSSPACSYSMLPAHFRVFGRRVLGAQSFDTMTAPDHRGRGLFAELARLSYNHWSAKGVDLVYGFPNESSVGGFVRHLGWQLMDPVPYWVRPVGLRYARTRLGIRREQVKNHQALAQTPSLPDDLDCLATWATDTDGIGLERNLVYLRWRLARPGARYRSYYTSDRGRTTAFGVSALDHKYGANVGYVLEWLYEPGSARSGRRVLHQMMSDLRAAGADLILAWVPPCERDHWRWIRAGFAPFPQRLRPIELHFGAAQLSGGLGRLDRNRWYLSYLDSDTV